MTKTFMAGHKNKRNYSGQGAYMIWTLTIKGQRLNLEDVINDNPGLRSQIPDLLSNAYRLAKVEASKQTKLDESLFFETCPWTLEQIRDAQYFPE